MQIKGIEANSRIIRGIHAKESLQIYNRSSTSSSSCRSRSTDSTPSHQPTSMDQPKSTDNPPKGENTKSYWRCSKQDFFPEKSFQSWAAYRSALRETPFRVRDRFVGRSDDAAELGAVRKRSENDMKRCLTWWDLTWFGFGSVIGAGIFVLTGQEAHDHAGPAIVLSYVASG